MSESSGPRAESCPRARESDCRLENCTMRHMLTFIIASQSEAVARRFDEYQELMRKQTAAREEIASASQKLKSNQGWTDAHIKLCLDRCGLSTGAPSERPKKPEGPGPKGGKTPAGVKAAKPEEVNPVEVPKFGENVGSQALAADEHAKKPAATKPTPSTESGESSRRTASVRSTAFCRHKPCFHKFVKGECVVAGCGYGHEWEDKWLTKKCFSEEKFAGLPAATQALITDAQVRRPMQGLALQETTLVEKPTPAPEDMLTD